MDIIATNDEYFGRLETKIMEELSEIGPELIGKGSRPSMSLFPKKDRAGSGR
jgi:hypothetical protein